ncbi:MAG: hypothetical protein COB48_15115 [Pseudoalteromonas sp.]|nr:MAG: hypothetical protein COB48_15115 [Pseudoalteromonas sp.]
MGKSVSELINNSYKLICREIDGWWKDGRRHWCAYCGIPMKRRCAVGSKIPPQKATRDHVIPKVYEGSGVTIPCCRSCNQAKGIMSLPKFMAGDYYKTKRKIKHRNKWPESQLWAVVGMSALKRSLDSGPNRVCRVKSATQTSDNSKYAPKQKTRSPLDRPAPIIRFC